MLKKIDSFTVTESNRELRFRDESSSTDHMNDSPIQPNSEQVMSTLF